MLNGFGTVVNALGKRVKPYLPQICGTILWRLNNKSAKVRQQAADLISRIAQVMMTCGEASICFRVIFFFYFFSVSCFVDDFHLGCQTSVTITDNIPFPYYSYPNVQTSLSTSLSYDKVTNLPYAK